MQRTSIAFVALLALLHAPIAGRCVEAYQRGGLWRGMAFHGPEWGTRLQE